MMEKSCAFDVAITERDVADFARLSGDFNPLHMEPDYARTTEFGRPIAHGALLVGLVSRVLGMYIPGRRSLILSMKVQFPKPLFFPSTVSVNGELKAFNAERETGVVAVTVTDKSKLSVALEAEVQFSLHATSGTAAAPAKAAAAPAPASTPSSGRPRLLVTGGTGGIGSALLPVLAERYDVLCLSRRAPLAHPGVGHAAADLDDAAAVDGFLADLSPAGFRGVVHLSSPPMSRGFVSDDLALVRRHLRHSVELPLAFARWAKQPGSSIKRMVLFGSTAGAKHPAPHAGAYSLGKASLEHVARLLVGDLSAIGATVNVVVPSLVPVGMNEGLPERARKALAGRMPTGRLVDVSDIAPLVEFLLSDASSQINGSCIAVDGGAAE